MHQQRGEVGVLAFQYHLVHRRLRGRNLERRDGSGEAPQHFLQQAALVGTEGEREAPPAAHDVADELRAPGIAEPHRLRVALEPQSDLGEWRALLDHLDFA